jgi:hypothetical protein
MIWQIAPAGHEPGHAADVHRSFDVAGADQRAAVLGHQREDVAGRDNVVRPLRRINGHRDSVRPVVGRDAGGDPFCRLDRDGEGFVAARLVLAGHSRQAQLPGAARGNAQADQAAGVLGHEVDLLRRGELRRDDDDALVLPALGTHEDIGLAVTGVLQNLFDRAGDALHRA